MFYSNGAYSLYKVDTPIISGGSTPSFSNTKSILLDGIDDFVGLGTQISLGTQCSFSLWLKRDVGGIQTVLGNNNPYGYLMASVESGGTLAWWIRFGNGIKLYSLTSPVDTTDGNWHHYVISRNGSTLNFYVDGQSQNLISTSGTFSADGSLENIGADGVTPSDFYSGKIDEVAVFNSELSATDVTTIYNSGVPNDISSLSPLSWWRCGDGDTAPILTDNGSGGNDGTMNNFSTFSTDVPPNPFTNTKSILLDGIDDYIDCGNPASLQIIGAMTLSAWVKTTSTNSGEMIIGKDRIASGKRAYILSRQGSNARFIIFQGGSSSFVTGTSTINDGNWHHILGVNDGTDLKIYVDGVLEATNSGGGGSIDNGNIEFYIGRRVGAGTSFQNWWTGNIDEVAVWNSDQSANASTIYNGGEPNDISSLSPISWWRCGDSDTAPILNDNGSGGNDGTMVNFSTFSTDVPTFNTKSILLDGIDDFVNIGTSSLGITTAISVSAWVKIPTTNTGGGGTNIQVIACEDTTSGGQRNWMMFWRGTGSNYFAFVVHHTNLSSSSVVSTSVVPNDGQWHHLLGTYDGTSNANGLKLYVDGGTPFTATASSTGINSFTPTEPTIGAVTGGGQWRFEGNIDEVAIWDSDQNANASTIYNSGVPTSLASLNPLSWWRCGDGDTAPTLTDNGSGGNNGTMNNFTTFSTDVPT